MPTIRDVAELAGVSTATVSHVINDSHAVRPDTRRRVLAAIERLNYRPSAIARSLTTSVTRSIGVMVADITNPFFGAIVRGIEDRLETHGYNLIVCNTDEQASREARYLELLLARRVDGMIIAPTGEPQPLLREFVAHNIPLV
ncbi:MAG: LacI family DNA-binding transcriptional regulator, partial [Chloroflexota bacterium]